MPLLLAQLLRFAIIALVQSAILVGIESVLNPLIDKAKEAIKNTFHLSDNDALTYISNFILDTLELAGLTVVLLKSRLPLKVADKLGFTSRGFVRGALPAEVSTGAKAPGAAAKAAAGAGKVSADTVAEGVATTKGLSFDKVKSVIGTIATVVGVPVGTLYMVAQFIDYAAWNGSAYQSTFQKIFSAVGLQPDKPLAKASTVSDDVWSRVYNTYTELGAYAISDPFKLQSVVFSKQALIDLVDKIGAQLNAEQGSAPAKAVLAATHALVLLRGQAPSTSTTTTTTSSGGGGSSGTSVPSTRVFTGVLSQGVLGAGLLFQSRPDDLIESVSELQSAASNNLAAALAALPAQLSYELKIVSSVITKDGFKQTGAMQQVVSGYNKDGSPKYKNVTNKFAVMDIYLLNEKGTRTKVRSIILGPTNVLKFNPTSAQISGITDTIKTTIATSNTNDIASVISNNPLGNTSPSAPNGSGTGDQGAGSASDPYTVGQKLTSNALTSDPSIVATFTYAGNGQWSVSDTYHGDWDVKMPTSQVLGYVGKSGGTIPSGGSSSSSSGGSTTSGSVASNSSPSVQSASTLSEYFAAKGTPLPSVSERALIYQGLGLGQSSMYTGTAEQNTKLLAALKSH